MKLLRDALAGALGEEGARQVDVNTIDGFQVRYGVVVGLGSHWASQHGV